MATTYKYYVNSNPVSITLNQEENIIAGDGCSYANVYDSYLNLVGTSSAWEQSQNPISLPAGQYTVIFKSTFSSYTDTQGVLFYPSSGITLSNLPLNQNVYIPTARTEEIYKLSVNQTTAFSVSTANYGLIHLYDEELNYIGSSSAWDDYKLSTSFTLNTGTYYVTAGVNKCDRGGGSFTILSSSLPNEISAVQDGGDNHIIGNQANNILTGLLGNDVLYGEDGNDGLFGGRGNDKLNGGKGDDIIDGNQDIDTVYFSGMYSDYSLIGSISETLTILGVDGTDELVNIERIVFDDKAYAYDIDGEAAEAYRLYQAAFDRTPDKEGLGYWIVAMDDGMTLQGVASSFIASQEFENMYGANSTDEVFTTLLYNNILNRNPDAEGMTYWLDELGQHDTSHRAGILVFFSESVENQANVVELIGNKIEYIAWA